MSEMKTGICPACQKELTVPAELEEFSCLYCGARILRSDWEKPAAEEPAVPGRPLAEAADELKAASVDLARCVYEHRSLASNFGKKHDYAEVFEKYSETCRPVLTELQRLIQQTAPEREQAFALVGSAFMDEMDRMWSETRSRGRPREEDRMTLVIFLIPLIRLQALPWSDDLCLAIRDEWVRRYPKEMFQLANYDDIAGGFRRRWCFITTAVCQESGRADDCYELTAFRRFRDDYLAGSPEGRELIEEYYRVAPAIVSCMTYCDDLHARCREIEENYLAPCLADIESGNQEACRSRYVAMVRDLEKRYFGA